MKVLLKEEEQTTKIKRLRVQVEKDDRVEVYFVELPRYRSSLLNFVGFLKGLGFDVKMLESDESDDEVGLKRA